MCDHEMASEIHCVIMCASELAVLPDFSLPSFARAWLQWYCLVCEVGPPATNFHLVNTWLLHLWTEVPYPIPKILACQRIFVFIYLPFLNNFVTWSCCSQRDNGPIKTWPWHLPWEIRTHLHTLHANVCSQCCTVAKLHGYISKYD